ncbi:MAG TPA: hypothetical protein PK263_02590 [bacterium]|nr:hypothetical protein [bacterium]
MKTLVVARHGSYGDSGTLSALGKSQMDELASSLRAILAGQQVRFLSSTALRAKESTERLIEKCGAEIPATFHELLWSESGHPENLPGALDLIKSECDGADVVVLVTHLEYAEQFPNFFCRKELGMPYRYTETEKGQAWVVDCEQRTLVRIP